MTEPLLTIAIPTYNRPKQLERCLRALAPQLTQQCRLHITDNHSLIPAQQIVADVFSGQQFQFVKTTCRPFNTGAFGNLYYCFESAVTPWLWILGDDDTPEPNAIKTIFEHIDYYRSSLAFVFRVPQFQEYLNKGIHGEDEFLDSVQAFLASDALFCSSLISSAVYHTASLQRHFSTGCEFGSSFYPHLAILIRCLQGQPSRPIIYSQKQLVSFVNDGICEQSPSYPNVRYLSRLLRSDMERSTLLSSQLVVLFVGSIWRRLCFPTFWTLVAAGAYRHTVEGSNVIRRMRRLSAESTEWDLPCCAFPWIGLMMTLKLGLALTIGRSLSFPIQILYRLKCRNSRSYPTLFDPFEWRSIP
jgi:glycosyltransferase involved in cell wall biosynthesis